MNDLAVIDWELGKSLAGGSVSMAKELLQMLIDSLPEHEREIKAAFSSGDRNALRKAVHKLHGAACYCPTPQLKQAAADYEAGIKCHDKGLDKFHDDLLQAIANIQQNIT